MAAVADEKMKKRLSAADAYAAVSRQDGLLYHIANARKENSSEEYDGEALKAAARQSAGDDIARMREASELFRAHSIKRP